MKKSIVILLVILSIFVTSCTPQVTVTSEVAVTLSTKTQTPEPSATPTAVYTPTPAKEIITNPSGIGFELGAQIEGQPDGVKVLTDIVPPDVMDSKKKADFETRINPMTYGFKEGETRLVYIPTEDGKGRVELQRTSNPADVIAVFGSTDFVWEPEKLVDDNGDPIALRVGKIIEMPDRKIPRTAGTAASRLMHSFYEVINRNFPSYHYAIFVSRDGTRGVQFNFNQTGEGKGYFYFLANDGRTVIYMYIEGYDGDLSFAEGLHY